MNKKTIIIIILLAVAAFIAYRKGWFAKLTASDTAAPDTIPDPSPSASGTDDIINATTMTEYEKEKCRGWVRTVERAISNGSWSMEHFNAQMVEYGRTYNQEIVAAAIYQMYASANPPILSKERAQKLMNEVDNIK